MLLSYLDGRSYLTRQVASYHLTTSTARGLSTFPHSMGLLELLIASSWVLSLEHHRTICIVQNYIIARTTGSFRPFIPGRGSHST